MKWTFVLKEDLLVLGAIAACGFSVYLYWQNGSAVWEFAIPVFGGGAAFFYSKMNKARWCSNCNHLMTYGKEPSSSSSNYEIVYTCSKCGRRNRSSIETER